MGASHDGNVYDSCLNSRKAERSGTENEVLSVPKGCVAKGGVACPFPWKLHECLTAAEDDGLTHIVSWQSHGRSFTVHKPKEFVEIVMPRYFGQTKYPSFQRQLNLYGFSRFAHGKDKGSYYHLCFVRGHSTLVRQMVRRKINGNKVRHTIEPSSEPDFYHPFWKNHFEATYPPKLLELQCAAVVKALCNKAISDNSSSTNNNTSDLMNIPSAVIESETTSNTNEKSKLNDQVMILPRLPVSPIPSTITSTTPPSSTMDSLGECSAVWATLEESVDEGDMFTFEGIPFHFLDGQDSDELQNSATSILGTEDDNFSVSSVRRFGSGSFLGSSCADLLLLDQEPLLLNNNLAV